VRRAQRLRWSAEHVDVASKLDHGVVDQLDRNGLELDDVLGRVHGVVEAAEVAGADCTASSSGHSLSSILVEKPSVPSEPTRIWARLWTGALGGKRIEIVAADSALHLRKPRGDLVGFAHPDGQQLFGKRPQRRAGRQICSPAPIGPKCAAEPSASTASIDSTLSRVTP